jgi:hypothetical protein
MTVKINCAYGKAEYIHASCSSSVEDCSLHYHHWVNRTSILNSNIKNRRSHGIEILDGIVEINGP